MSKKIALYSNTSKPSLTYLATAETVASNADLLTEILVRVPVKSLIKFKSVSKQWLSIISDSQFSRSHTTHHPPPLPSGLYFYYGNCWLSLNDEITSVSVNGHPRTSLPNLSFLDGLGSRTKLLHSSNGLMLCSTGENGKDYVVCNLTTQRFVVLPMLAVVSKPYGMIQSYLVFDPKKSPYYKVAVVIFAFNLSTTRLAVYSSESSSWKIATLGPGIQDLGSIIIRGALWDRAIIFMQCMGRCQNCAAHDHVYLRFDIDAEKLTTTRVSPTDSNLSKKIMYFGECGDRLLLVQISEHNAAEFKVLEMLEGETDFRWAVKYVVDLPFILQNIERCMSVMKVGANESDLAVVFYISDKVTQYTVKSKTWEVLCDFTGRKFTISIPSPISIYSYPFIESLTPF